MSFNGAGAFVRTDGVRSGADVHAQQKTAGVNVRADLTDTELEDMATGMELAVLRDGQNAASANLPMGGFKHTGVTAASGGSSRTEYTSGGTVQDGAIHDAGDTGGTSTAFTATLSPAITAYANKQLFRVKFNAAFGATPTINFNTVGAKKMYYMVGSTATQLTTNNVPQNYVGILRYDTALDSAAGAFLLLNPPLELTPGTSAASESASGIVELATNAEVVTGTDTARAVTPAGLAAAYRGKMAVFIPAGIMIPQVTNGPSRAITEHATNDVMVETLDYDQTTSELAQFGWRMPESWNESTVTFRSVWTAAAGSAAETFICGLKAMALSDDDAIDGSWGTGVTVSDALIATGDVHISAESSAVTVGGTPAAGDYVIFNVYRDISDTLAADARLIGIVLNVTTNAGVDG